MIGITELMIVLGVFALVGLHLATCRYLIRRQEEPNAPRRSVRTTAQVTAPARTAAVGIGHNDVPVPAR